MGGKKPLSAVDDESGSVHQQKFMNFSPRRERPFMIVAVIIVGVVMGVVVVI